MTWEYGKSPLPRFGYACTEKVFLSVLSAGAIFGAVLLGLVLGGSHSATAAVLPLHAEGRLLKNSAGEVVTLRGLNVELHAWAYDAQHATNDPVSGNWIYNAGESALDADMAAMAGWILLEEDFARIRSWGANVVRLQVPHYLLDSIKEPAYSKPAGYALLDRWLTLADRYDLYVVLDLHVPYGGRQYTCDGSAEGKTLWRSVRQQERLRSLWRTLAGTYKNRPGLLFQLMNEPYPECETGTKGSDRWWTLAQDLVGDVRAAGATNVVVVSSPLGQDTGFRSCTDPAGNLLYDVHFYLPFEFTHQQAWWITPPPPSATYPTTRMEWVGWTSPRNGANYAGSPGWTEKSESITIDQIPTPRPALVGPAFNSWNNTGSIAFDNCRLSIDGVPQAVHNHDLETAAAQGGLADGWDEWKSVAALSGALWREDAGNHYLELPPTPGGASHNVSLAARYTIPLPATFASITVSASLKGENSANATVFGVNWFGERLYDKQSMRASLQPFLEFGQTQNVPVACLEFGVIMNATADEGHLLWLDDLGEILHEQGLHFAYHEYRGLSDKEPSFGIYQCWGKPARECARRFEFVMPALFRLLGSWRSGEADHGGGWKWSSWFGYYNTAYEPWVYHAQHGWLYPYDNGNGAVFFWYNDMQKFVWTSPTTYPFLYRYGANATWVWYQKGSANPRRFFNYVSGAWESLP